MTLRERVHGYLLGLACGDALGVPVDYASRSFLRKQPIRGMTGYGSHHQPPGTWSDDSSLSFQLVESLIEGYTPEGLARRLIAWYQRGEWTPGGQIYDVGLSTRYAIDRLERGISPQQAGAQGPISAGNGSLMRVLPLAFVFFSEKTALPARYARVQEVSCLTHRSLRPVLACFLWVEMGLELLHGTEKHAAYARVQQHLRAWLPTQGLPADELELFSRVLENNVAALPETEIFSSAYCIHSLEAALWCFLNAESFSEAVLSSINLGDDTETTGSLTGSLAGIYEGSRAIPAEWTQVLARRADIDQLADRFFAIL